MFMNGFDASSYKFFNPLKLYSYSNNIFISLKHATGYAKKEKLVLEYEETFL